MAHELYVLQTLMLSRLRVRREVFFDSKDLVRTEHFFVPFFFLKKITCVPAQPWFLWRWTLQEAQKNLKLLASLLPEVESRRGLDPFVQQVLSC